MTEPQASAGQQGAELHGGQLILAGLVLALANFVVVLDTTIANVSVPHIAGDLGISSSQGTWIITSYAVAEAICVPLTGWLTNRFGAVRLFIASITGFGLFSVLCGLSPTLLMLLLARVGQGFCGGPLMPLSQTLLLRIFPRRQHGQAMGIWAMTTVVAPVLGPILGGAISDNWSWNWIFFINVPVVVLCAAGSIALLIRAETPILRSRIDLMGLLLLIVWIGAFQVMLDLGQDHDWFGDPMIVALAIIAAVGFLVFLVWELTAAEPVVNLRVFRHRGFTVAVASIAFAFGTFFASAVIIPQWLQESLGYTATWAGYVTALTGVMAVFMAPLAAKLMEKVDPRLLVSGGILWLGLACLLRMNWTSGADYETLALPQFLQGFGLTFFFVPVTVIALGAVEPAETASAAGVMNFLRTMSGAIGTSVSVSWWADSARLSRSEIVGNLHDDVAREILGAQGMGLEQIRQIVENYVTQESLAVATDQIFLRCFVIFLFAALVIWLSPRPPKDVDTSAAH